jgi:cardiolipin synthase
MRRSDLVIGFAPSVATTVEPLLHGRRYFPRMLEDLATAQDHIHILMYGFKRGDIGSKFRDLLVDKVREGVSVRLVVDALGSEIQLGSRGLYAGLRNAGVMAVANHGLPLDRILGRRVDGRGSRRSDLLIFDHRKLLVIDGRIGYVGGSGIEDHYADERFYDVMCRVTGPITAQLQLVFLASWRYQGGEEPSAAAVDACFPVDVLALPANAPLHASTTVLWNVPGTPHHPISNAIEGSIATARDRIDIVNPYVSNRRILDLLHATAARGVPVRIIVPGKPTPPYPAAAFRHHYRRLIDAGVEILLHSEMAHAKVIRIDDRVLIGGCNLDDLSLFRNDELDLLFEDPAVVELVEHAILDELASMSTPAVVPTRRRERIWNAAMNRASRLL